MNARIDLPEAREVCPTTTRRLLSEGALLVDVRERAEVAQAAFDVPDLVVLPLSEFERRFAELPRDRELVLACQVGERSLKAAYYLMYHGYSQVAHMGGGLAKWALKGFPVLGQVATRPAAASACCGGSTAAAASPCCGSDAGPAAQDAGCCGTTAAPATGPCC